MRNILILAADTREESADRRGDLFDSALLEIVRVLDVSSEIASVLVPWSDEFAPLVAVAVADTAPSFDPESAPKESSRSGLIPYRPSEMSSDERSNLFREGSHLSLTRRTSLTLAQAVNEYPLQDVIVLSLPKDIAPLRAAPGYDKARFLVFGSLLSRERAIAALNVSPERVEDLEGRLHPVEDKFSTWRGDEEALEPFVPFGLLIQDVFEEMLPDVDDRR